MKQFGLVTAITIALALVTSVTVLPALLALWSRRTDRARDLGHTTDTATSDPTGVPVS